MWHLCWAEWKLKKKKLTCSIVQSSLESCLCLSVHVTMLHPSIPASFLITCILIHPNPPAPTVSPLPIIPPLNIPPVPIISSRAFKIPVVFYCDSYVRNCPDIYMSMCKNGLSSSGSVMVAGLWEPPSWPILVTRFIQPPLLLLLPKYSQIHWNPLQIALLAICSFLSSPLLALETIFRFFLWR